MQIHSTSVLCDVPGEIQRHWINRSFISDQFSIILTFQLFTVTAIGSCIFKFTISQLLGFVGFGSKSQSIQITRIQKLSVIAKPEII